MVSCGDLSRVVTRLDPAVWSYIEGCLQAIQLRRVWSKDRFCHQHCFCWWWMLFWEVTSLTVMLEVSCMTITATSLALLEAQADGWSEEVHWEKNIWVYDILKSLEGCSPGVWGGWCSNASKVCGGIFVEGSLLTMWSINENVGKLRQAFFD